ncbi:MAG: hypothetical protein ACTH31_03140 [Pseudoclavibacter sp.]
MFNATAARSIEAPLTLADGPLDVTPFIVGAVVLLVLGGIALFLLLRRRGGAAKAAADATAAVGAAGAPGAAGAAGAAGGHTPSADDDGLLDGDDAPREGTDR